MMQKLFPEQHKGTFLQQENNSYIDADINVDNDEKVVDNGEKTREVELMCQRDFKTQRKM